MVFQPSMLGSPGGQCVEPEAFGEGCAVLQVQSSGWGHVGMLSEQQPGSRFELSGTRRASLWSSGRGDSKPKGGEEVCQCSHSCRDNRLTKARRFVKKRGFFFFSLSAPVRMWWLVTLQGACVCRRRAQEVPVSAIIHSYRNETKSHET